MKTAFVSEIPYFGKFTREHPNMRVEFAWMVQHDATHFPIGNYQQVEGFDEVYVIIPKGELTLNAVGADLLAVYPPTDTNPVKKFLGENIIQVLKGKNVKVFIIQEGPTTLFNDWSVETQMLWYSNVMQSDGICCHNTSDVPFYEGLFKGLIPVTVKKTVMIDTLLKKLQPVDTTDTVIIGGNFSRWYGGFQSWIVASELVDDLNTAAFVQTSHSTRFSENLYLNVLPRMSWIDWMDRLRQFKYAVHLMPTVAAGTFNLNCAYWGIPCIGNKKVDTQRECFPLLSVDPEDVLSASILAQRLRNEKEFYTQVSEHAKRIAREKFLM